MKISKQPQMRLVSDGTSVGTKLYDKDGNEIDLSRCHGISWHVSAKHRTARVYAEFFGVQLEATGEKAR
jgi:hypothetical protein